MFTAKTKIAFALSGVVTCLLIASKMLGVVPERGKAVMNGRAKLCESIAITGSILLDQTTDAAHLETALIGIVKRNPDLLSAGLRDAEQNYLVSTKSHDSNWTLADDESSNERCMFVPLFGASGRIGRLELCFTPIVNNRVASFIDADVGTLILFVGPCTFLAFSFVLGLVLKQLDPSGAVPKRVVEALDSLAEGLLIIDVRDRVLLANQAFGNVIGVDSEKLIGYRAARLGWLANGEPLREEAPWQEALAAERPVSNRPLQLQGKNGLLRSFVVNASPVVTGSDGKFRGVLVTFDDVTTLEQKKVELGEAKDAAETANRAKSEFLANMSHEIRTPMNAILGFTDVLRRGLEDDQNKRLKYLDTIHSSGSHLIELINDILDLSKIEAGKLELEISAASPYQIMSEVVDVLKVRAEQKGIYLRRTIDGQIPESIQTDSTRLRQVFTNIIGNAIKFTEQGGVELICCFDPSQTDSIEFKVVDTGIGMTQQQAERIFNPFEQADSSVTRRFGGTGLGLSISKRFAEALGGHISVTQRTRQRECVLDQDFDRLERRDWATR